MKKILLRCGMALLSVAVLVGIALWIGNYSPLMEPIERYKCLANAFTVAGVVMLGVGSLVWISTTGFFDGFGYMFLHLTRMLIPGYTKREPRYADYKAEMAEKRKGNPVVLHVMLAGLLCMAITAYYMVKFYQLFEG